MPEHCDCEKLLLRFIQPSVNNDWFAARQLAGRAAHAVLACGKRTEAASGQERWPFVWAWLEVARQNGGKPRLL